MEPNATLMQNDSHQDFLNRYEPIHAPFVRYCSSKAFGIMDAEDLVQEAIFVALKGFEKIKDKEKMLSFLIGTVNNIVRSRRRKEKRQSSWEEHLWQQVEGKTMDPEIALDVQLLMRSMKALPLKEEEALILFEISGFSVREIAALQQSSEAAVKTRLSRARTKLKNKLNDQPVKSSLQATLAAYLAIIMMS